MSLKAIEIEFLSKNISRELAKANLLDKEKGYILIKSILERLKEKEDEIEKKAKELLEAHISRVQDVNVEVAFEMIKKRIAKDMGIVL